MACRNCTAAFLRLLALTTIANFSFSALTAQEIRIDPESLGATDVRRGTDLGSSTQIINPTSPLILGTDSLFVGGNDNGKLSLTNGAFMTSSGTHIGASEDSIGSMTLFGAGTTYNAGGLFRMSDGFESNSRFNIGNNAVFNYSGANEVIEFGKGERSRTAMNITGGGRVSFDAKTLVLGPSAGLRSESAMSLSGAGSEVNMTGSVELGSLFTGSPLGRIQVSDGGRLNVDRSLSVFNSQSSIEIDSGGQVEIGRVLGITEGTLRLSGDGTIVKTDDFLAQLNGSVDLNDGATLETKLFRLGSNSDFRLGSGSILEVTEGLQVGGNQPRFVGGRMILHGDREFDGASEIVSATDADDDTLLDAMNGEIGFLEDIEVLGNVDLQRSLTIDGGRFFAGSISTPQMIDFRRGQLGITASDVEVGTGGTLGTDLRLFADKDLTVSRSINVANDGRVELNDALLTVGSIENRGMTTGRGTIRGNINNRTDGEFRLANADRIRVDGDISNEGMVRLTGGTLEVDGQFVNQAGGKIAGRGAVEAIFGLNNNGDVQFSGGDSDVIGEFTNTGRVELFGDSSVTFHDGVFSDSEFAISEGSKAVFLGDLDLGSSSSLAMELGDSLNPLLSVDGDFVIDGDLFLAFSDGYTPEVGDKWLLASGGELAGEFDGIFATDFPSQYRFGIDQTNSSLSLSIIAVPEPSSLPIAMLVIAGIVKRRRTT